MIKIIGVWNGSISGEFTTTIDLFYNLKKYINIELHLCVSHKNLISNCISHLIKNNNSDLLNCISLKKTFKSECIICTSFILYNNDINLLTKNLFILDTFDLIKNNYNIPKLKSDNIIFFSNPANITKKIPYNQIEYYHKFSYYRLNNLPSYYKTNLKNKVSEPFLLDEFYYCRTKKPHIEISPNIFFENIGKRIFEHLYHKKKIFYDSKGFIKDGLFYYLKLCNIDGSISCNLNISEQIIKEKLFMHENDILLKELRKLKCL